MKKVELSNINTSRYLYGDLSLEQKLRRRLMNGEPIQAEADLIFQDRDSGVNPGCDPRTDRFDVALEAADRISKSELAQRDDKVEIPENESTDVINENNEIEL